MFFETIFTFSSKTFQDDPYLLLFLSRKIIATSNTKENKTDELMLQKLWSILGI